MVLDEGKRKPGSIILPTSESRWKSHSAKLLLFWKSTSSRLDPELKQKRLLISTSPSIPWPLLCHVPETAARVSSGIPSGIHLCHRPFKPLNLLYSPLIRGGILHIWRCPSTLIAVLLEMSSPLRYASYAIAVNPVTRHFASSKNCDSETSNEIESHMVAHTCNMSTLEMETGGCGVPWNTEEHWLGHPATLSLDLGLVMWLILTIGMLTDLI